MNKKDLALLIALLAVVVTLAKLIERQFPVDYVVSGRIGHVLETSATVVALEYRRYSYSTGKNDEVLTEKVLTRNEVLRLAGCFTRENQMSIVQCVFEPHHTLICHRFDGTQTTIRICMACQQISVDDHLYYAAGGEWFQHLSQVLPECGIPVRDRPFYEVEN